MAVSKEVEALLRTRLYGSKKELMNDAVRALMEMRPDLRVEVAVELYREREVTLWRAAEVAGMGLEEFKEVLSSRGIKIEVGGDVEDSEKRLDDVLGS